VVGTIRGVSDPKRLYVLRHAKSSWDDHAAADHERPLSERGRRAVRAMAAYMEAKGIEPELVLCSSARRTRETLEGLGLLSSTVIVEHRLYGASSDDLIERLRSLPGELGSVMLVGHNPAMQDLVLRLAAGEHRGRGESAERLEEIRRKLPTGALVTLETTDEWAELDVGSAELVDYVRPKGLQFP
jgi:phosphohistidine phosphatase